MLDTLQQGSIYLVKGTLNQFAYEVRKLSSYLVHLNPDWTDIKLTVQCCPPFGEHQYLVIYTDKVPTDIIISAYFTLLIFVSEFDGEVLPQCKKIFKACHAPYYAIKLGESYKYLVEYQRHNNNYNSDVDINIDINQELKAYINDNPQTLNRYNITDLPIYQNEEVALLIVEQLYLGCLDLWSYQSHSFFYRYLIKPGSKINYQLNDKAPFGIPIQLWIYLNIFYKYKALDFNLYPEYLFKLFAAWVYLSKTAHVNSKSKGLTRFVNKLNNTIIYAFSPSAQSLSVFNSITNK